MLFKLAITDTLWVLPASRIPAQQEHPQSWGAFNDFPSGLTADTQCVDVAEVESEGRSVESIGETLCLIQSELQYQASRCQSNIMTPSIRGSTPTARVEVMLTMNHHQICSLFYDSTTRFKNVFIKMFQCLPLDFYLQC